MRERQWAISVRLLLGVVCGTFSLFCFLCIPFAFEEGLLTGSLTGVVFLTAGGSMAWVARSLLLRTGSQPPVQVSPNHDTLERCILALVSFTRQPVTIAEVALHCGVSLQLAKVALAEMVRTGIADVELDECGDLVYAITALLHNER